MTKETYVKPAVISETLEPEALAVGGSGGINNPARATLRNGNYSSMTCCENNVWPWW